MLDGLSALWVCPVYTYSLLGALKMGVSHRRQRDGGCDAALRTTVGMFLKINPGQFHCEEATCISGPWEAMEQL